MPIEFEVPSEIDRQFALLEQAPAEAKLCAGVLKRLRVRMRQVQIRGALEMVGQPVADFERGAIHRMAREIAARRARIAVAVTARHKAVERFEFGDALAERLVGIDLELEGIDLRARVRSDEDQRCEKKNRANDHRAIRRIISMGGDARGV